MGEILSKTPYNSPTDYHSESILVKCYEKKIPVFCPALSDSGIGLMIWGRKVSGKEIFIDANFKLC